MIKKTLFLAAMISFVSVSFAQINLINPSFEDEQQDAKVPNGWNECKQGSTPDILPGFWGVYTEPSDGESYIGLITREDGSWESIGQRLDTKLEAGSCYTFNIDLAHSKTYSGYSLPVRIRIWASKTRCSKDQLIEEINAVKHTNWKSYLISFITENQYNYIIIEAFYMKGVIVPYKGNILIDNITPIEECDRA